MVPQEKFNHNSKPSLRKSFQSNWSVELVDWSLSSGSLNSKVYHNVKRHQNITFLLIQRFKKSISEVFSVRLLKHYKICAYIKLLSATKIRKFHLAALHLRLPLHCLTISKCIESNFHVVKTAMTNDVSANLNHNNVNSQVQNV